MKFIYEIYIQNQLPLLVFLIILFISGIAFGTIAVNTVNYELKENLFSYFNNFLRDFTKLEYDKARFMHESIKFNMLTLGIIFLLGLTVIIMPVIILIIFFKGFVLGFSVGFLIDYYSYKGLLMAFITILPQNIFIIPAYLLSGLSSISFSFLLINYYRNRARLGRQNFIDFFVKNIILAFIMLGGTLIETYISPILMNNILNYL